MKFAHRLIATLALAAAPFFAGAAELAYTKPAFDAAVAAGKPVVVDFAAPWCPTCKAQKPIIDALMAEPANKKLTLFKADYDTEKALKQQLNVSQQSTLVVFKGGKEVARSTGETRKDELAALFAKAS